MNRFLLDFHEGFLEEMDRGNNLYRTEKRRCPILFHERSVVLCKIFSLHTILIELSHLFFMQEDGFHLTYKATTKLPTWLFQKDPMIHHRGIRKWTELSSMPSEKGLQRFLLRWLL